jgi:hemolysin activation/secretion protein
VTEAMKAHLKSSPFAGRISAAALTLSLGAAPALAQDYAHVAPKLPPAQGEPIIAPPAAQAASTAPKSDTVLIPRLTGLVFVGGPSVSGVAASPGPSGVSTSGVAILDNEAFKTAMQAYVGRPFMAADLESVRAKTKAWLVAHGRPFADVTVPPQNVASGVVRVTVTEYRLGKISVEGERYFSPRVVLFPSELHSGQTLDTTTLQADLNRLNQNPFLSVNAVFKPGDATGVTDLQLQVKDRFPVRVYAGYDNEGYPLIGLQEWFVGANWGNAFGTGQILSYQYTRSFNGRFTSHSASDVIPLGGDNKLLIFGAYAIAKPSIAAGISSEGHSGQASVRLVHGLPSLSWLSTDIQLGFDYKSTDNNLEFLGLTVLRNTAEVDQFPLILDANEHDRFGRTTVENDTFFSPGHLTAGNNNTAFAGLTPGATTNYVYDRLSFTRTTPLPANFSLVSRGVLQVSSGILPNSEQLGAGGVGSARGYYTDTALGSTGYLSNTELRLPAFSPLKLVDHDADKDDLLQFGGFFDYAKLRQPKSLIGGEGPAELESVGVLAHYSVGRHVEINFDLGWRLKRAPFALNPGHYGAISVTVGL